MRSGEERVQWLRRSVGTLKEFAVAAERIAAEADELFSEIADGDDVWRPDPLVELSSLGSEGLAEEAEHAVKQVEARQGEIEARLRGEWRSPA